VDLRRQRVGVALACRLRLPNATEPASWKDAGLLRVEDSRRQLSRLKQRLCAVLERERENPLCAVRSWLVGDRLSGHEQGIALACAVVDARGCVGLWALALWPAVWARARRRPGTAARERRLPSPPFCPLSFKPNPLRSTPHTAASAAPPARQPLLSENRPISALPAEQLTAAPVRQHAAALRGGAPGAGRGQGL
jgi:hypothetical protein